MLSYCTIVNNKKNESINTADLILVSFHDTTEIITWSADCTLQIKKTTKELFLEVTSASSLQTCKDIMDALIVVSVSFSLFSLSLKNKSSLLELCNFYFHSFGHCFCGVLTSLSFFKLIWVQDWAFVITVHGKISNTDTTCDRCHI